MRLMRWRQGLKAWPLACVLAAAVGCGGGMEPSDSGIATIDGNVNPMGAWPGPIVIQANENCSDMHSMAVGQSMVMTCYQPPIRHMAVDAVSLEDFSAQHFEFDLPAQTSNHRWILPGILSLDGPHHLEEFIRIGADGRPMWRWRAEAPFFQLPRGAVEWDGSVYALLYPPELEEQGAVYLGRWTPSEAGVVAFDVTRVDTPDDCPRLDGSGVVLTARGSVLIMTECSLGVVREVNMDGPVRTCRIPTLTTLGSARSPIYQPPSELVATGCFGPGNCGSFYLADDCSTRFLPPGAFPVSSDRLVALDGVARVVSILDGSGALLARTPALPEGAPFHSFEWVSSGRVTYVVGSSVMGTNTAYTTPFFSLRHHQTEGARVVAPFAISSHPPSPASSRTNSGVAAVVLDDEEAVIILSLEMVGGVASRYVISRFLPSGEEDLGPPERD